MATKKSTVKGKAYWAKVFEANRDKTGYQDQWVEFDGMYTIDVMLDKDNRMALKASGSAIKGKVDDDMNFIAKFKRKHKDRFDWASGAPEVLKADGSVWSYEEDGIIPNESIVEVEFTVFTTSMSPGTRLEKITVLEVAELPELEPKKEEPKAKAKVSTTTEDDEDEVPF